MFFPDPLTTPPTILLNPLTLSPKSVRSRTLQTPRINAYERVNKFLSNWSTKWSTNFSHQMWSKQAWRCNVPGVNVRNVTGVERMRKLTIGRWKTKDGRRWRRTRWRHNSVEKRRTRRQTYWRCKNTSGKRWIEVRWSEARWTEARSSRARQDTCKVRLCWIETRGIGVVRRDEVVRNEVRRGKVRRWCEMGQSEVRRCEVKWG